MWRPHRRPREQPRLQALHEPHHATPHSLEHVVRTIVDQLDDYLRAPHQTSGFGDFADISRTSPDDQADRGVTIHLNRVLPDIPVQQLADELSYEFVVRGLYAQVTLDGHLGELHIPHVF